MADANNQKMLLVVNPVSGKKMAKQYMMRMINRFDQAGYNVTACCTQIDKNAYLTILSISVLCSILFNLLSFSINR